MYMYLLEKCIHQRCTHDIFMLPILCTFISGSALKVFYNDSTMTNAYLVYGFNDKSFRVWVDSSANGGNTYYFRMVQKVKIPS